MRRQPIPADLGRLIDVTLDAGRALTPSGEIGLRYDWGNAETGFGLELGGQVQYSDPAWGLTLIGAIRGLLAA